jgi:hypothetical protein
VTDRIAVLHALDGAGMPLLTQSLGSMNTIAMLSRIHPTLIDTNNPLEQAYKWFGLIDDDDLARLSKQEDWAFNELIQMLVERAEKSGRTLVIGDCSNPDFVSDKPVSELPGFLLLSSILENDFEVTSAALVRHPVDQWIDLQNKAGVAAPALDIFLRGYHQFAKSLDGVTTYRFEDVLSDPVPILQGLCEIIGAAYDADWEKNWRDYTTFVGEPRHAAAEGSAKIEFTEELLGQFKANDNYAPTLELLGYESP